MKTNAEARAERVAKFGLETPRIFGIEMEEANGAVPYWTHWSLEIGMIRIDVHHRGDCQDPWEGRLELPFYQSRTYGTHRELEEFIEDELRKLRDALVEAIP